MNSIEISEREKLFSKEKTKLLNIINQTDNNIILLKTVFKLNELYEKWEDGEEGEDFIYNLPKVRNCKECIYNKECKLGKKWFWNGNVYCLKFKKVGGNPGLWK